MLKFLSSIAFSYICFALLCFGVAYATFVENDFGTPTARVFFYDALWFELLLLLSAINLVLVIRRFKMHKKIPQFLFHISFIVILIGAILTRFFGVEGVVSLTKDESKNSFLSAKNFISVKVDGGEFNYPFEANAFLNSFSKQVTPTLHVKVKSVEVQKRRFEVVATLHVEVVNGGKVSEITLTQNSLKPLEFVEVDGVELNYGSRVEPLPFVVGLAFAKTIYYPGSFSPSTYESALVIEDKEYEVKMNEPLNFGGYAFYQSSPLKDGMTFWVNRDPGKWPTYLGYTLLFVGLILNLFSPNSRVRTLVKKVRKYEGALALLLVLHLPLYSNTYEEQYFEDLRTQSLSLSREFGRLQTQTIMGRVKPLDTLNREIVRKITGSDTFNELNANQVILGMSTHQRFWRRVPLIVVKDEKIKELIGIPKTQKHASFEDFFTLETYKLDFVLSQAVATREAQRSTYEKELIKVDERLNIAFMVFSGSVFKIFPNFNNENAPWLNIEGVVNELEGDEATKLRRAYINFSDLVFQRRFEDAKVPLSTIKEYVKKYGSNYEIEPRKLRAEIFLNEAKIFQKLILGYIFLGLIVLVLALCKIVSPFVRYGVISLLCLLVTLQSFALVLRWFVGGFVPLSNTYESIIYIALSCAISGLVVFRKSLFGLSSALLLAGVFLFVANLGNIDPEITPLVPVLKSFWLSIHVGVITASYGFFGVSALIGFIVLAMFGVSRYLHVGKRRVEYLTNINEISLIVGLSLLVIGNFLGGIWANESWGRYWGWDPKESWTFISILVYSIVIHLRFFTKVYSNWLFGLLSLISFGSIIMTYFGVNFYLAGLHSYATGDAVPIPIWVYYALGIILILGLTSYKNKNCLKDI